MYYDLQMHDRLRQLHLSRREDPVCLLLPKCPLPARTAAEHVLRLRGKGARGVDSPERLGLAACIVHPEAQRSWQAYGSVSIFATQPVVMSHGFGRPWKFTMHARGGGPFAHRSRLYDTIAS